MYAELYSWENLLLAYRRAEQGQACVSPTWPAFERRLEDNLLQLQRELRDFFLPAWSLCNSFYYPRTQAALDLGGALPRPGGAPCPVQPDRAGLRALVYPRFVRQPGGQGHPPRPGPRPGLCPALPLSSCSAISANSFPVSTIAILAKYPGSASCPTLACYWLIGQHPGEWAGCAERRI